MLLTITTTRAPATDIGYLLHKHPARFQEFGLAFGKAYVFYPEATDERCTAALLLDVDPIAMVRGKPGSYGGGPLDQYVNDRPYVASSFLSVAISQVFGSALRGTCKDKPDLVSTALPLRAKIAAVPCKGGEEFLRSLFEPLGYRVSAARFSLDEHFPQWGESNYYFVELEKDTVLCELLTHLYVLIPVLDNYKHYYVGDDEVEKLLDRGKGWLAAHPEREAITRRYLKYRPSLARQALERLMEEDALPVEDGREQPECDEQTDEATLRLNDARIGTVLSVLKGSGARRVLDLGCGEGKLLMELMKDKQFEEIVGMDVSIRSLEAAHRRLRLDDLPSRQKDRICLIHGSLMYRDRRLEGFDAAAAVEVVEHLDPPRLSAFERVVFEHARPRTVVLTTPNREYNVMWEDVGENKLRHKDHRFEWTRAEFRNWAERTADRFGYKVRFLAVGPEDQAAGAPTQLGVFELCETPTNRAGSQEKA